MHKKTIFFEFTNIRKSGYYLHYYTIIKSLIISHIVADL